jgi:hypothetical protein
VLYAPLACLAPQPADRVLQIANLALVFACGWFVSRLSAGRVWWPLAVLALMIFPGFAGSLNLGQNATLSLCLLLAGWYLMARGRPVLGGVCWGFLAFKPVWAVAFFPVLPLTGRWRAAASMAATGLVLCLATLPVVGVQSWFDWLAVGKDATVDYQQSRSWIFLSRDLVGLPRRYLLDWGEDYARNPNDPLVNLAANGLWLSVCAATLLVALWRRRQVSGSEGPGAAFVLLGGWLSCYHFMYYDVLLAALPLAVLWTDPARYLPARFRPGAAPAGWLDTFLVPALLLVMILTGYLGPLLMPNWLFPPFDTFSVLLLWGWCGWKVLKQQDWATPEVRAIPAAT